MTLEQESTYRRLEALAGEVEKKIQTFDLAVLESNLDDPVKLRLLEWTADRGFQGIAYFLHPQSEWTGGDNFKVRAPHIEKASW